jgi:hypothetical protein
MTLPFKVKDYLPENLHGIPLYDQFSEIFQAGLDKNYAVDFNNQIGIYDPSSPVHDFEYIISLLGGRTLLSLLSDKIDILALELLLPGIYNLRGTATGFELLLRLLKIDFQTYYMIKDRNGCYYLTIVISDSVQVNLRDLPLLEKLSQSFLTSCVTLRGITNCYDHRNDMNNGKSLLEIDISWHLLDENFILDNSLLDMPIGHIIENTRLVAKLCYKEIGYVETGIGLSIDALSTTVSSTPMYADISSNEFILDEELKTDTSDIMSELFAYSIR